MKKTLFLALILVLAVVGNAGAITWTYAGGVFDQEIFDGNNNTAPIDYPNVAPHTPSPGGTVGEMFDFEGVKCGMDDEYLYFAITASFDLGVEYKGFYYWTGDFFFGFDGMDTQFGIDYNNPDNNLGLFAVGSNYSLIPETPYGYYQNTWVKTRVGAYDIDEPYAQLIGDADREIHSGLTEFVTGDTYVSELRIAKSYLIDFGVDFSQVNEINYRQTISCGNDFVEGQCNVIPEPTTLALLGLGLIGTGIISRRKK